MIKTKFLAIGVCLFILVLVVELVRREKLTFKYAVGWIFSSLIGIFLAGFDQLIAQAAAWLGFQLPSNFIFFAVLCGFVFLSFLLTIFLCQQNNRNDRIAQKLGILEHEMEKLKKGPEKIS